MGDQHALKQLTKSQGDRFMEKINMKDIFSMKRPLES